MMTLSSRWYDWRSPALALTLLGTFSALSGQESNSLISNSPFLPADFQSRRLPSTASTKKSAPGLLSREIKFRGLFQINGEWEFCIYDQKTGKGVWVPLNSPEAAYNVVDFNPDTQSIRVKKGDLAEEIFLEKATDTFLPGGSLRRPRIPVRPSSFPKVPSPPSFTPPPPPSGPPSRSPPTWHPERPSRDRNNSGRSVSRTRSYPSSSSRTNRSKNSPARKVPGRQPPKVPPSLKIPGSPPNFRPGPPPSLPPGARPGSS